MKTETLREFKDWLESFLNLTNALIPEKERKRKIINYNRRYISAYVDMMDVFALSKCCEEALRVIQTSEAEEFTEDLLNTTTIPAGWVVDNVEVKIIEKTVKTIGDLREISRSYPNMDRLTALFISTMKRIRGCRDREPLELAFAEAIAEKEQFLSYHHWYSALYFRIMEIYFKIKHLNIISDITLFYIDKEIRTGARSGAQDEDQYKSALAVSHTIETLIHQTLKHMRTPTSIGQVSYLSSISKSLIELLDAMVVLESVKDSTLNEPEIPKHAETWVKKFMAAYGWSQKNLNDGEPFVYSGSPQKVTSLWMIMEGFDRYIAKSELELISLIKRSPIKLMDRLSMDCMGARIAGSLFYIHRMYSVIRNIPEGSDILPMEILKKVKDLFNLTNIMEIDLISQIRKRKDGQIRLPSDFTYVGMIRTEQGLTICDARGIWMDFQRILGSKDIDISEKALYTRMGEALRFFGEVHAQYLTEERSLDESSPEYKNLVLKLPEKETDESSIDLFNRAYRQGYFPMKVCDDELVNRIKYK